MEILQGEVTGDLELFAVHLGNVSRESGQRVTARTTDTDKHGMTTLLAEDTVDLGNVDDSVLKKHNVHLLNLGLLVVLSQAIVQTLPESLEVRDFFVVVVIVSLQEINENGINISTIVELSGARFFVVDLEVQSELFVQDRLEQVLISD